MDEITREVAVIVGVEAWMVRRRACDWIGLGFARYAGSRKSRNKI